MKSGDTLRTSVLRLLLGEIDTLESVGKKADFNKIVKKLIDSNNQMLAIKPNEILTKENEILSGMLPRELTKKELEDFFNTSIMCVPPRSLELYSAKSEGQAIGIAVKALKESKLAYNSNELIEIVKEIRNGNYEPKTKI